ADSLIRERNDARPGDPLAPLAEAARLQAEMFAREERFAEERMHSLLDSAAALLNRRLTLAAHAADSARILYFIGVCQTHTALWESKWGSLFSAVKEGFHARDNFTAGLALDSSFAELKLGLGAYQYWKSAKGGGLLRSVGLINDQRLQGVALVRASVAEATISPDAARSALLWILLDLEAYTEAEGLARGLCAAYPDGAAFLWPLAECYRKSGDDRRALETYLKLRAHLTRDPGNQINLIKVDFELAELARQLDDHETLALVENSFDEYSQDTPRQTRRKLAAKYRALKRL
ncbi:MAG TPA: hypothetical protein VLB27_05975, partial [candidate division Zixibacteria bacterium]|nr:hypothetical protein [candidate division Zixibacteria bacterium]